MSDASRCDGEKMETIAEEKIRELTGKLTERELREFLCEELINGISDFGIIASPKFLGSLKGIGLGDLFVLCSSFMILNKYELKTKGKTNGKNNCSDLAK